MPRRDYHHRDFGSPETRHRDVGATAADPADGAPPPVFRIGPDPETGDPVSTPVAADIVFRPSGGRLYVALAADPDAPLGLDSFETSDTYEAPWAAGIDGDVKTYPSSPV